MKMKKAQTGKMVPGEMTGKMYKKSEIDAIGDKQAKELDKSGVFGKAAMAKKKAPKAEKGGAFGMLSVKAGIKKAASKMVPGEMTGKMYKKSEIDEIGRKQAKELDKSGVFGKAAMALSLIHI